MAQPVIRFETVSKLYGGQPVLHRLELEVQQGEFLTLIGRSGCGKTTALKLINGLIAPDEGRVLVRGQDVAAADQIALRRQIGYAIQGVGLFPHMTVEKNVAYVPSLGGLWQKGETPARVEELLGQVGLDPALAKRYPRELSGGQRQRVGIARALAVDPEFIVCDEPVSALDVSIQAQVVNMFEDLQNEMGLTYLFIAHDLSVVKHISSRIGVMYLGKLVELADSYELTFHSVHPYTRSLISAIPVADPKAARESQRIVLEGDVPSPLDPPSGCRFRTRCPYADEQCAAETPAFKEVASGHWAACHHLDRVK